MARRHRTVVPPVLAVVWLGAPAALVGCAALVGADWDRPGMQSDGGSLATEPLDAGPDAALPTVPKPVTPKPDGTCAEGRKKCDGLCVSVLDPAYGCATSSCTPCSIAYGFAICRDGACGVGSCEAKRADCNSNATDGCETNTSNDPLHCGSCTAAPCENGLVCADRCVATCPGSKAACSGACIDLETDSNHCGGCDKPCPGRPNGVATCTSRTCGVRCNDGFHACGSECVSSASTATCGTSCTPCVAPANAAATCGLAGCDFTCDHGFKRSGAACIEDSIDGSKVVFVSSVKYNANLGGLAGADSKCQTLAATAGLTGTFKAWLSGDTVSAASRLTHSAQPYKLVTGETVANDWTGLTSGTLVHAIDTTESGAVIAEFAFENVWTNTAKSGESAHPSPDWTSSSCQNWTYNGSTIGIGHVRGRIGASNFAWTENGAGNTCNAIYSIYCMQQ